MTIIEAITQADELYHNSFTQKQKVIWLSRLESMIHRTVLSETLPDCPAVVGPPGSCHSDERTPFEGFTEETPKDTVLTMGEPFDEAYIHWLHAQMHLANFENDLYNASASMFSSLFEQWKGWWIQHHRPKNAGRFRW